MKAAWIITGFAENERDYNGAPAIHKLAEALSNHSDIELDIYTLYYPVNIPEYKYFNARVFSFATKNKNTRIDKYIIWKKAERKFSQENAVKKYDIIHSLWSGESGNLASRLSKKHKVPFITSVCGGELAELKEINYGSRLKYWQKKFVDISFSNASNIITGSEYISRLISKYYGTDILKKTVNIPFGVDDKLFYPADSTVKYENRFPVLLNAASAVPVKNHKMLVKAFMHVKERYPNAFLVVCGYDEKGILKNLSESLGICDSVIIKGFVPYESLPEIINSADIYVLSSLYESQNLSLVEAALCGKPIVSTAVGIAEDITEHITDADSPVDFADKILSVTENIKHEKNITIEKLNTLRSKYSIKPVTDKTIELYKTIIADYDKL
jgi:glycosyltransferase involved in cell wall biosynthesis